MGKQHTEKAVPTLKKKKKKKKKRLKKKKTSSLQREPTWEHKDLSDSDSILYTRCGQSCKAPEKVGVFL